MAASPATVTRKDRYRSSATGLPANASADRTTAESSAIDACPALAISLWTARHATVIVWVRFRWTVMRRPANASVNRVSDLQVIAKVALKFPPENNNKF